MQQLTLKNIDYDWEIIIDTIRQIDFNNEQKVDAFLPLLKPQAISNNFLLLTANNKFIKFWIESHILPLILEALKQLTNNNYEVQIEVDSIEPNSPEYTNIDSPRKPMVQNISPNNTQLKNNAYVAANLVSSDTTQNTNPETVFSNPSSKNTNLPLFNLSLTELLTFENFVIGNSNNMAYQTARAVAESPGKPNLNPLFIYGRSGVGKTHLLHAIKNYINSNNPNINTIYIDATAFVNEYTDAATAHDVDKTSYQNFRRKYENAQVLLVDDLQLLQDKKQTLNIFFSIFNNISNLGRQIVISADRAPKNIDVDERYTSRFNNGISCEISYPEVEVKIGIIKSYINDFKKEEPDIDQYISDEVINYIAQNSSSNIRELKSAITKLLYEVKYKKQCLSIENVKYILGDHFSKYKKKRLSVPKIQKTVEDFYKISHTSLVGKTKDRNITYARQVAMYLCSELLDITTSAIGQAFQRDHSTVIHSINKITSNLRTNRNLQEEVEILQNQILERG